MLIAVQIGLKHGQQASRLIAGSLAFYQEYFERKSKMDWPTAEENAQRFLPFLEKECPDLVDEMRGVAEGANVSFESILALNVRTEISMGMMTDGCTTLGWKTDKFSLAGQNWDWEDKQKDHLVLLHISRVQDGGDPIPAISQVTEAGILGKIGLNSAGVGVCMNAIRAPGVNFSALPVHLAQRIALNKTSRKEALDTLTSLGIAAAVHVLVADSTGATSLESSALDLVKLEMRKGRIAHSNHFLAKHDPGVCDAVFFPDSRSRMERTTALLDHADTMIAKSPSASGFTAVENILADEDGFPTAINRKSSPGNGSSTLFSIVMDLGSRKAVVKLGRPTENEGVFLLQPGDLRLRVKTTPKD